MIIFTSASPPKNEIIIDDLINEAGKYLSKSDIELIKKAYSFLEKNLEHKKNDQTVAHFKHSLRTAFTLTHLNVDANTISAALLYELPLFLNVSLESIQKEFNSEIIFIISHVIKLFQLEFKSRISEKQIESLRKVFLVIAKDLRVILIKIVNRLHTLQDIYNFPHKNPTLLVKETLQIYCPILNLLGIWQLLGVLEDICFQIINPHKYSILNQKFHISSKEHQVFVSTIQTSLLDKFKKNKITANIEGRMKHLYSIYKKILERKKQYTEIYDVFAFRIITKNINDCYTILGIIHSLWRPKPGRFKDYIATPKSNGYQSLHTTVFGPNGKLAEFQIRTQEMDNEAEYGIAAHFFYKTKSGYSSRDSQWIRDILQVKKHQEDDQKLLKNITVDVFKDRIFVFTPKGDIIDLPKGATCLDFAYHINQELGHRTAYARVNNNEVSIDKTLNTGDTVEIVASINPVVKTTWISYVKSAKALKHIKSWFQKREQNKKELIGQEVLNTYLKMYLNLTFKQLSPEKKYNLLQKFKIINQALLFKQIGAGNISMFRILRGLYNEDELLQSRAKQASLTDNKNLKLVGLIIVTHKKTDLINKLINKMNKFKIKIFEIIPKKIDEKNQYEYKFIIGVKNFKTLFNLGNEIELLFEVDSIRKF
jgi:GTP pyrophosphokinase